MMDSVETHVALAEARERIAELEENLEAVLDRDYVGRLKDERDRWREEAWRCYVEAGADPDGGDARHLNIGDAFHMSGECLCGAFATEDELQEIAGWFPDVAVHIQDLERKVEQAGHPACRWGKRPPKRLQDEALFDGRDYTAPQQMLCLGCENRADQALAGDEDE